MIRHRKADAGIGRARFPGRLLRIKEPAQGVYATFVNGRMLMKEGRHTGNLPGRVLRNSRYQAAHA